MTDDLAMRICAEICQSDGMKAREIALRLGVDRQEVNRALYRSALLQELCWQDRDAKWHGLIQIGRAHV